MKIGTIPELYEGVIRKDAENSCISTSFDQLS